MGIELQASENHQYSHGWGGQRSEYWDPLQILEKTITRDSASGHPGRLKSFKKSISEREARQEKQFVDIISINKLDIINISLNDNIASISIRIESEQIKYTIDKNDKIIDGNKEVSEIIKDKWVLERDISSNNPNSPKTERSTNE